MSNYVTAVRYIASIGRGTSRPKIFLCDDGKSYVIKPLHNTQGPRVIPNEWMAWRLGRLLGLPVPEARIVTIPESLCHAVVPHQPGRDQLLAGPHFGSLYERNTVVEPTPTQLAACVNLEQAAGMIVFDNWIRNWDRCWRRGKNILIRRGRDSRLLLIDHGCAFTGPVWTADSLASSRWKRSAYWGDNYAQFVKSIDGPDPFRHPLEAVLSLNEASIGDAVRGMPQEWNVTEADSDAMSAWLLERRDDVPLLLQACMPHFPVWRSRMRRIGRG